MSIFTKSELKGNQLNSTRKPGRSGNPAKLAEQDRLASTHLESNRSVGYLVGTAESEVPFNYVNLDAKRVKGLLGLAQNSVLGRVSSSAEELVYERFQKWLTTKPKAKCEHYGAFNMKAIERLLIQKQLLLKMDHHLDEKTLFLYTKGWLMAEYEYIRFKDKQPGFQYVQGQVIDAIIKIFGREASLALGLNVNSTQGEVKRAVSSKLFPIYFTSMLLGYLKHRDALFEAK